MVKLEEGGLVLIRNFGILSENTSASQTFPLAPSNPGLAILIQEAVPGPGPLKRETARGWGIRVSELRPRLAMIQLPIPARSAAKDHLSPKKGKGRAYLGRSWQT